MQGESSESSREDSVVEKGNVLPFLGAVQLTLVTFSFMNTFYVLCMGNMIKFNGSVYL